MFITYTYSTHVTISFTDHRQLQQKHVKRFTDAPSENMWHLGVSSIPLLTLRKYPYFLRHGPRPLVPMVGCHFKPHVQAKKEGVFKIILVVMFVHYCRQEQYRASLHLVRAAVPNGHLRHTAHTCHRINIIHTQQSNSASCMFRFLLFSN